MILVPEKQIIVYKPSELGDATPVVNLYSRLFFGEISISQTELEAIEAILGWRVDIDNNALYGYSDEFISELTKTVKRKAKRLQNSLKKQTR